jgi:hypothetical protein
MGFLGGFVCGFLYAAFLLLIAIVTRSGED